MIKTLLLLAVYVGPLYYLCDGPFSELLLDLFGRCYFVCIYFNTALHLTDLW